MLAIKAFLIALGTTAIAVQALAKPVDDLSVRAQKYRGTRVESAVAVSMVGQASVRYSPETVGVSAEYQRELTRTWLLTVGGDLGFHEARTLLAPYGGVERHLLRLGPVDVHGGGGLTLPMQFLPDSTATALAIRGVAGARWNWSMADRILPHVQVVAVAGPMLFPDNVRPSAYVALQLVLGASYSL
jgi:hypothetical protein